MSQSKAMTKFHLHVFYASFFVIAALLSACVSDDAAKQANALQAKPVVVEPPPPASPPPETPEQIAEKAAHAAAQADLDSIIGLYNNGDYQGEIKRFTNTHDALKPYKDLELLGLKFTAFSYCLIGRLALCKLQFEKAFKLDPSFDLKDGEKGHPIWGKVFDRAKKKETSPPK
jgi:hypothetical protein